MKQTVPELEEAEGPNIELVLSDNGEASEGEVEPDVETRRIFVDQDTFSRIVAVREQLNKQAPGQGPLLRRGALITLFSYFEALISDLIQLYYALYPAKLSEKQTLSLDTLRTIDPTEIGDIERYLAANEANDAKLDYFTTCLNLPLNFLSPDRPLLTEISQRRNLIVHNQGIVNRQYLSKVAEDLIEEYEAKEGKTLPVTGRYVDAAIDTVYTVGVSLIQLCWRKWAEDSQKLADAEIVHWLLYDNLLAGRFELVARVAERLKNVEYVKEKWAKMAIINHAIALGRLNRTDEMERVLSQRDWSASSLDYKLALHALRNEEDALYELLPKAVDSGEVTKEDLEKWPVFAPQRATERFSKALEEQFGV